MLKYLLYCQIKKAVHSLYTIESVTFSLSKNYREFRYTSSVPLQLAKNLNKSPSLIAAEISLILQAENQDHFTIEFIPPGLINFTLTPFGLADYLTKLVLISQQLPSEKNQIKLGDSDQLFSLQYSHARCCSILKLAENQGLSLKTYQVKSWLNSDEKLLFTQESELSLINQIIAIQDLALSTLMRYNLICRDAPWLVSTGSTILDYNENCCMIDFQEKTDWQKIGLNLSDNFQHFYSQCRIFGSVKNEQIELAQARLGLILITRYLLHLILVQYLNSTAPLEL